MWRHRIFAVIVPSLILFASQAGAQQQVHRIAYLGNTPFPEIRQALLQGLHEHGYDEGQNLQIEYRYSQGQSEKVPALIAELIALSPEIIITSQSNPAIKIHTTAPSVPLLLVGVGDPVGLGLVESLRHPGGNVTGIAGLVPENFISKQLQLLKELVPHASRIAVLIDPTMSAHQRELRRLPEASRQVGVELFTVEASRPDQYEAAFEKARAKGAGAIHVWNGPLPIVHRAEIAKLAARYRLPAIYLERRYVEDGGLLSYGMNTPDLFRRAGGYVDKILKGEKPGDIPVEQPTRFELIVNLKAAKALGITVPSSIFAQADEVIE
jgi:putative tryptophan/tyrosine transport system substrate-binding protein